MIDILIQHSYFNKVTNPTSETFHVRPRFKTEVDAHISDIEKTIKATLDEDDTSCIGTIAHGYATINIPAREQHFWSPQLTLSYEEFEGKTILRGLYGPKPAVWTMFVFFYAIVGIASLAITMVGLTHLTLDKSAHILWLLPVAGMVFLSLFLVARFGQNLGKNQLNDLQEFVGKVLTKLSKA